MKTQDINILLDKQNYSLAELLAIVEENSAEYFKRHSTITSANECKTYIKSLIGFEEHEVFGMLFLDNKHRVINQENMFRGTIDAASVHVREVVKTTLQNNAAAVILYHNHPSGVAEPSQSDIAITNKIKSALDMVDVRTLDHIIVGQTNVSFSERGLI